MADQTALLAVLSRLGIEYQRYDHEAVFTCEEADRAMATEREAAHTKNLFLRDQKGRRHWLLVTSCAKQTDLRTLAAVIGADKLGLASPERLARYLDLTPGSVTVFGLLHDREHHVELLVDEDVWSVPSWRCHPMVNTATLVVAREGIERFLAATGHVPRIVAAAGRGIGG